MESSIVDSRQKFYIPKIQKPAIHLPHVRTFGRHHFDKTGWEAFNCLAAYQCVLWRQDYSEHIVSRFSHQIQSEYYGGNR